MKPFRLIIPLVALLSTAAPAQQLLLAGSEDRTALYLNLDKAWNYNYYEHSRWGAGLRVAYRHSLALDGYLVYGTFDQQWKYGLALTECFNKTRQFAFYQRFEHDYFAIGSRRFDTPWDDVGSPLGGFLSSRMTVQNRLTLGFRWATSQADWAVELVRQEAGCLFDDVSFLYLVQGHEITMNDIWYGRFLFRHASGLRLQAEIGPSLSMARLLAQFKNTLQFSHFTLKYMVQGGVSAPSSDYENMFDLGGTWGASLYIGDNLLTARPNEFTANNFVLLSLRLQTHRPLFDFYSALFQLGSNPTPFVGINLAWGHSWHQDSYGQCLWQSMFIQTPYLGILEPSLGLDGIIRWGAVDWGAAFAYRIVPQSAPYHLESARENITFLITAKLNI